MADRTQPEGRGRFYAATHRRPTRIIAVTPPLPPVECSVITIKKSVFISPFCVSVMSMHPGRLIFSVLVLAAPLALHAQREKLPPEDLEVVEKQWPQAKKTSTGLRYIMLQEGAGDNARPGDMVNVLYRGSLLNGKVFDEAQDPAHPFTFRLGRLMVIQGWDQGLQLMKKGAKMLLIVPSELGYGSRGNLPEIPRDTTLVFEIELLDLKHEAPLPSMLPPPAEKKKN